MPQWYENLIIDIIVKPPMRQTSRNSMLFLINLMVTTLAVYFVGQLLEGITIATFGTAILVAVLLKLANALLRPLLFLLTLPINVLTLGLFSFVIMGFMVWVVNLLVPGFEVENFSWAIGYGTVLFIVNWLSTSFTKKVLFSR